MTTEDFAQGMVFGRFMEEVHATLKRIDMRLRAIDTMGVKIMGEVEDLQSKVEAQTGEISQLGQDMTEMTTRVDALLGTVQSQIDALTQANADLTSQRDALTSELGADHAAVAAVSGIIDTNTSAIDALQAQADAFHADQPPA